MKVLIPPFCAEGTVRAMPSKSMAHRALIAAALAPGTSRIAPVSDSSDMESTISCLTALGARLVRKGEGVEVTGFGGNPHATSPLCPRDSGSTLRFLIPIALLTKNETVFCPAPRLMERPLGVYEEICAQKGLTLEKGTEDIRVRGRIEPGEFVIPGDVSSQFMTGLLFALPLLDGDSRIRVAGKWESASYVSMTLEVLRAFGVTIEQKGREFFICGNQTYAARDYAVEGDWSNAAFWDALTLMGGKVTVTGLKPDSLQGDRVYREYFEQLKNGRPRLSLANCPDLAPVLFVAAGVFHGAEFYDTARLRYKESDRGEAMRAELKKCGVNVFIAENSITVEPGAFHAPKEAIASHGDHRVVMAMSVLLSRTGGVITGAEHAAKSDPHFFETLQGLGAKGIQYETES